jgi:hypothetical protein
MPVARRRESRHSNSHGLSPFSSGNGALRKSVAVPESERAKTLRAAAQQARRLAQSVTNADDRDRMLAYAKDLEAQADALERSLRDDGKKEQPP